MSNVLKVSHQTAINSLKARGWSDRRIARELGLNRRTVVRYGSKCTTQVTPGSEGMESKCTTEVTSGKEENAGSILASLKEEPKAPIQSRSVCAAYEGIIEPKIQTGLSAQRIYQDLVLEAGFRASYQSVKRYVGQRKAADPKRIWRIEVEPGEEVQVDFGLGAMIDGEGGKRRRTWVLRMVLSHSRKGYSEAVLRQDTESFLRAVENGLRAFGGVPQVINVDNLKAAVVKADWWDPEINPKMADFCRHYGMHVMPCRPATPQHKGKVERGVAYVRHNALKGHRFTSLAAENAHLQQWESQVADKRIHGTTRRQVAACFEEERPHLQALPDGLFPLYQEAQRTVGRDSFVEVARAFYEAPPEYIGRQVWVRWDSRMVRIVNQRHEQVQAHPVIEPGKFSRTLNCAGMSRPVLASCRYWSERLGLLGDHCQAWASASVEKRGPEALRSLMGLWSLSKKYPSRRIDLACQQALESGARRLKDIKRLLEQEAPVQKSLPFEETHPLIRDLSVYRDFIQENEIPSDNHLAPLHT